MRQRVSKSCFVGCLQFLCIQSVVVCLFGWFSQDVVFVFVRSLATHVAVHGKTGSLRRNARPGLPVLLFVGRYRLFDGFKGKPAGNPMHFRGSPEKDTHFPLAHFLSWTVVSCWVWTTLVVSRKLFVSFCQSTQEVRLAFLGLPMVICWFQRCALTSSPISIMGTYMTMGLFRAERRYCRCTESCT